MSSPTPRRASPLGFTPWPVTIITTLVYLAIVIPLLVIHLVVPSAPKTSPKGLDLDQAWLDLEHLTGGFHPYNTHRNDEVHGWLLRRIGDIVNSKIADEEEQDFAVVKERPEVFVFDDVQSNLTFAGQSISGPSTSVYFEGANIIVYIRGSDDEQENWWETPGRDPARRGGVLVNSHYDSVSTGYGATDDGVGVITCLQLIQYFTTPGHAPRRGLVVLFNNGEEDFLNGAWAFSQHPMSRFTHTFLNLEGAGAGGRAMLFRSSDTEVTGFYKRAKHPFGTVLSSDGFNSGLLRSQTDYVVFDYELGMRGLDVAFIEPRARYHTDQDDAKHTSRNSLWHMLSAAVSTTEGLVSDTTDRFEGEPRDEGKVPSGTGSKAVWFDLFGRTFAVFQLHTLFALSVTLLIVAPLTLLATSIILARADKMYLFRSSAKVADSEESVRLQALRGLFRFPFLFVIPTAVVVGLAYLITKVNPYIAHSSQYAVWTMMVSAWLFSAWFVARVADFARPSAFHRAYSLTWMFVVTWVLLVIVTTWEHQLGLAGGYFSFFVFAGVFLAAWTAYLELFSLPRKSQYVAVAQLVNGSRQPSSYGSRLGETSGDDAEDEEQEEPTETTSLLRNGQRTTFANYVRVTSESGGREDAEDTHDANIYPYEQPWSAKLPQWMWILQFLLTAPIVLILVGPLALMLTSTLHQTGQDGSSVLFLYLSMAAFTTLLLFAVLPYIHRFTYHIPMFLLLVLAGTLIYNLVAFPFSETSRLKLFFQQEVDLDTGINRVSLTGIPPYVEHVTRSLPSAAGQNVACDWVADRIKCKWDGSLPHVLEDTAASQNTTPTEWMSFDVSKPAKKPKAHARFTISGQNTRACKLVFDMPIFNYAVAGSAYDPRFPHLRPEGSKEIRLWSREWGHEWTVDVEWPKGSGSLKGRAVCLWSDANTDGVIPALDEVKRYSPAWVGISKLSDGLVEASRGFEIDE